MLSFARVMYKTLNEFPLEEVKNICKENSALEGFRILANRLTKKRRKEIINEIKKEIKTK